MGILLWIGVIIVVQAFGEVPKQHMPAVVIGLFPALAAWALLIIQSTLTSTDTDIQNIEEILSPSLPIKGIISLERGFMFTSMILSSISVFLIDKQFIKASFWCLIASVLSYIGIIHSYKITQYGIVYKFGLYTSPNFVLSYLCLAVIFFIFHLIRKNPFYRMDEEA